MAATVELGTQEADSAIAPWNDVSIERAVGGKNPFDKFLYTTVIEGAWTFNPADLLPATVSQAIGYAEKAGILPDYQIILFYGYLREGYFAWPVHDEKAGIYLNALCDQRMFALTLLFLGERDAFTRHISRYPNIFKPQEGS